VAQRGDRYDLCFFSPGWCTVPLLAGRADDMSVGGAEVQVTRVGAALARRGLRVSFVVLDVPEARGLPAPEPAIGLFTAYQPGRGLPVFRYFLHTVPRLWGALRNANAAAYYVRGAGGLAGVIALFCRRSGAKFIFAVANDHDLDADPVLGRRDRLLFRLARRRADAIVVQTRAQAERLESLGLRGVLIPSACEIPEQVGSDLGNPTVLWAGRGRSVKRPELFVELARRLPEVRFTMALGEMLGDEALYRKVRAEALALPNVEFVGEVPFEEMPAMYARTWVLVNTSESEGFPNTFLEAWAREIPVVAAVDTDGLLSKGGLGFYCTSVDEMAEAVRRLWRDTALRSMMGRRGRDYVVARHSVEAATDRYLDLLAILGVVNGRAVGARPTCAGVALQGHPEGAPQGRRGAKR